MESVQQKLSALDKKSNSLVQEGKYIEAIDFMEQALATRKDFFGETSDEYYKTAEKLCEHFNMLSMIFLQKEKFDSAYDFLKKGEGLAFSSLDLKAVTYNNLACYYRRIGKLRIALKYLEDAINIEIKLEKTKTLADTYLNICAVHSQLGRHDVAMNYIMKSIILLQDELLGYSLGNSDDQSPYAQANTDPKDKEKQFEDRVAILTIAYHNLGVEYEHMKQYGDAIATYKKAMAIGRRYLEEDNKIIKNLQNILDTATQQIEEAKDKSKARSNKDKTVPGKQYSMSATKGKGTPSKDVSRTDTPAQGQVYGELEAQYKATIKTNPKDKGFTKKLSGELVSASSGFTSSIKPLDGGGLAKVDKLASPGMNESQEESQVKSSISSKVEMSQG